MTSLEDAINQMVEFGLEIDMPITDGKLHKARYMGERRKSGWYAIHEYKNLFTGRYGSWKHSEEGRKIKRRVSVDLDNDEIRKFKKQLREKKIREDELKKNKQIEARAKSLEVWNKCSEEGRSPYLERKMIDSCGARFFNSNVVVPMGREGVMRSLQTIKPDGSKKYLPGGEISGCYFLINGSGKVALVEGFATGASVHMATGWNVAVCFTASNLTKAAPYFRRKDAIICADNDFENEVNVGLKYGEIAAKDLSCDLVYPEGVVDFNDLHVEKGIEELKKCLI